MSSNKVDKITGELVTLANGSRMWVGSKAAHDAAIQAGTMPNNCLVALIDDYEDATTDDVEEGNPKPVSSNGVYVRTEEIEDEISDIVNVYGSKNLCPTFASGSVAGVTYTVNSDGSITAVGISNATTGFGIKSDANLPNGEYVMSAGADASTDLRFIVKIIKDGTPKYYEVDSANKEVSFTVDDPDSLDIYVRTNGGNVSINGTLYPMIRCASISDNTYVPYAKTNKELTDDLTPTVAQNLDTGITVQRIGKLVIVDCRNSSGGIPTEGLILPVAAVSSCFAPCKYYDGTKNTDGYISVYNNKLYVLNKDTQQATTGTYVLGQLVYVSA